MSNPIIAILGKPNVGKSTLFNRIIGKRESIVSSEEGVTRDRIYGNFDWQGKEFTLIDTGGYIPDSTEIIDNHVRIQAEVASKEADIIILLIDGRSNITSSDQYLAKQVQKSGKPYVLAINKIDELNMEELALEYYELGLGEYSTISAQNNRCVGDLLDEVLKKIPEYYYSKKIEKNFINLAIIGMPNVGKSSLMNRLLQEEKSIVTSIAGTTRDSIHSFIKYYRKTIRIIDTAGLRRKSKISGNIEYYSSVRTNKVIEDCDIAVVLIDAEKQFTNQDRDIIRQAIDAGKGVIIVINKWDLIDKDTDSLKNFKQDVLDTYPSLVHYPMSFISVLENLRVREILKLTLQIYKERKRKIKTTELNDFLKKATIQYPPPAVKGKNISIKYGTQVHHSPPIFAFFTNYPDLIPIHYTRYMENKLRDYFGLRGVPIKLSFRTNK
tara:strand:+ start:1356 stop:2672 length:1317 start_codon:yes stop_codon:yes gene_type:complete